MKKFLVLVLFAGVLTACSQQATLDPNMLTYEESQSITSVQRGVVLSVEQAQVKIEGRDDAGVAGAIIGGLAGSQIGQGQGANVGAAVGALGVSYLGKKLTAKTELAFVYTIEKKTGGFETISQTGPMITPGSPVLIRHFSTGRKTVSLDQSQGKTFMRAQETSYEGDAAAQAARKAATVRAQKAASAKYTKRTAREEAEYQLELESKRLNLESQRLDVEKKSKRVDREDDFINKELAN